MKRYRITTDNKEHMQSLIKDYRAAGFNIVTYTNSLVELETENEFITIEVVK